MKKFVVLSALLPAVAWTQVQSSPNLGMAEGHCRPGESGPSLMITVSGLKDRKGSIKAELYPANDNDFLADDNVLINAGKTFRRVVIDVPESGPVVLCMRAPAAGAYGLSLLHDRNNDRLFDKSWNGDGVGFGANPPGQGPFKPRIAVARVTVGNGPTPVTVRMMYRNGLLSVGPLK